MRVSFLCFVLLAARLIAAPSTLYLVHTNDIHSWFAPREVRYGDERIALGGAPVLDGFVDQLRLEHEDAVLFFDAGDFFQGTPHQHTDSW